MNSTELRIGNLVRDKNGNVLEIDAINRTSVSTKRDHALKIGGILKIESIFPIPLTEELLLKFDFNFKKLGFKDLSVAYGLVSKEFHFVAGHYYKKIEYVNQLQNLYHAFTGKELKSNSTLISQ